MEREPEVITNQQFRPYGKCIYCGTQDGELSDEHIIPHGLSGPFILPKASCTKCSGITSRFERRVLRGPMWPVRAHLQLKSRRRSLAPKSAPLTIWRGGRSERVELPLAEHPLVLAFPVFMPPSVLTGNHVAGVSLDGYGQFGFGRPIDDVLRSLGADRIETSGDYRMVEFAQMLGKIAWAMAAARGQLSRIDPRNCVLPALISEPNEIGRWVGTFQDALAPTPYLFTVAESEKYGHLLYEIQLFADAGTPRYGVLVGALLDG